MLPSRKSQSRSLGAPSRRAWRTSMASPPSSSHQTPVSSYHHSPILRSPISPFVQSPFIRPTLSASPAKSTPNSPSIRTSPSSHQPSATISSHETWQPTVSGTAAYRYHHSVVPLVRFLGLFVALCLQVQIMMRRVLFLGLKKLRIVRLRFGKRKEEDNENLSKPSIAQASKALQLSSVLPFCEAFATPLLLQPSSDFDNLHTGFTLFW
ncbi:hypothetical protein HYC85_001229 [Camellia sinensis]|uniref:Uncharacterized protein n=1 Tax=Camellia sinensis TaxID=4442 RepID=A0A7J7I4T1_CAMSI|nr:hypothetical protein HYC85_001229 [Camellia sinensis]